MARLAGWLAGSACEVRRSGTWQRREDKSEREEESEMWRPEIWWRSFIEWERGGMGNFFAVPWAGEDDDEPGARASGGGGGRLPLPLPCLQEIEGGMMVRETGRTRGRRRRRLLGEEEEEERKK
jgi:hypothetical protein